MATVGVKGLNQALADCNDTVITVSLYVADAFDDGAADDFSPYLTIRRHIQHAGDESTSVMWLRKVLLLLISLSCLPSLVQIPRVKTKDYKQRSD